MANKRKHDGDGSEPPRAAPGIDIDFGHVFVSDQHSADALTRHGSLNGLTIRVRHGNVLRIGQQQLDALAEACAMQAANIVTVGTASGVAIGSNGNGSNTAGDEEVDGVKDEDEVFLLDNNHQDNVLPDNVPPEKVLPASALPDTALPDNTHANTVLSDTALPGNALPNSVLPSNVPVDNTLPDSVLPGNVLHDNPPPNDLNGDEPISSADYDGTITTRTLLIGTIANKPQEMALSHHL